VFACKTAGGESLKGNDCGALAGLDGLVLPRLRKLADCPEAATTSGKLHLVVRADFTRDAVTVDLGREHGVATAEPLLACAKNAMGSASLAGIAHDNARYSVAYAVTFAGPAAAATPAASLSAAADGTAQVEWEVAIVRDAPRTGGKVLARLPRGTPLRVGASKDGWYPVKYGDGFGSDGWVYRGAIGK
jgi:Bacterial SH3 domain